MCRFCFADDVPLEPLFGIERSNIDNEIATINNLLFEVRISNI